MMDREKLKLRLNQFKIKDLYRENMSRHTEKKNEQKREVHYSIITFLQRLREVLTIYRELAVVVYSLQLLGCTVLTWNHLCSHHAVVVGLAGALHLPGALPSTLANHPFTKAGEGGLSLI